MGRQAAAFVVLLSVAAAARADDVYLKTGGRLSGVVVSQNAASVEIEVGAGRVTLPRSVIERVVLGESALSVYQARARVLAANDAAGWLELADFARRADLTGQAKDAYQRVLALQPDNPVARAALGYRRLGDQWLSHDEAMQTQGYVLFEGDWVTSVQRDLLLAERDAQRREEADAARNRAAIAEAEARAREAEARARTAEAEAQRAEDDRGRAMVGAGVWGVPVGGFVLSPSPCCNGVPSNRCRSGSTFGFGSSAMGFGTTGTTFGFSVSTSNTGGATRARTQMTAGTAPSAVAKSEPRSEHEVQQGASASIH
jgi:hypothetical protein